MPSLTRPSPRDLALFAVYAVVVIDIFASALSVPIMPFYVRSLCGCEEIPANATAANTTRPEYRCTDPICTRLGGPTAAVATAEPAEPAAAAAARLQLVHVHRPSFCDL